MQKRFTHLINKLNDLGNRISNAIATNKVLRCLNREWKPKVTVIKEANNLKALDLTALFGKLEEHEQELTCLEKYEKEHEKKMNKEKGKDKVEEKKSIALKTSSFKSSRNELSDVKKGMTITLMMMMLGYLSRDAKGHHKKSSKSRRAYVACETESDSSSDESFTSSIELTQICLIENGRKKKQVSPSKLELPSDLSYFPLQDAFDNLHREALNSFKKLASHEKMVLQLEARVLKSERKLEAFKISMLDVEYLESSEKMWYLDSECSRHMMGDISLFINFVPKKKRLFTYGDNNKGVILGKGSVGNPPSTTISDVMLIDSLKHNVTSISQLCDKGFKVTFTNNCCLFEHNEKKDYLFKGLRVNNTYMLNLDYVSLHNFSALRTPQQNGVVERRNRVLEELTRTMLNEGNLLKYFWADVISTACYVLNRILIRHILNKNPYELLRGRKPNVFHLLVFGCKSSILNNGKDNLGEFDAKADEGIFLGYSQSSKAYKVYNKRLIIVEESVHVSFDEYFPKNVGKGISFNDIGVSLHDILKKSDRGIDQPQTNENDKVEDDD
ncbi:uncharacterized protein LOC127137007 [Lathyrus oleraceus]|uniref:uncharacterized protein LOC127137007 n=1 Tax=Pisum sativum TaxID=3888 RepID=UPI0021D156E5|nr:uncharacterized protein LOC127137007 [Pisum sativum]